jgi:glyoxylase-like metal-dependent hydrolase (beta-lactamase superfamily II)
MSSEYTLGLHEVGDNSYAYLQPDGGWGYSNAGLIVGDGVSLLVDTLFDLRLTASMLDSMSVATRSAPVATVVNTHANGDHCYGNQLVTGAEVVASSATAHEMMEVPPSMLAALNNAPGEIGELFRHFFGDFEFNGIELVPPTRTFDGRLDIEVGGRVVELIEVGPAHTQGDTIAYVADSKTLYTGDMAELDIDVVVPGHGPLTDKAGIARVRDYLSFVLSEATLRHDAGMDAFDAAREIARDILGDNSRSFAQWKEFGRISVNVDTVYRSIDATHKSPDVIEQFRRMAKIELHPEG